MRSITRIMLSYADEEELIGGGEILKYMGNEDFKSKMEQMDINTMLQFALIKPIKAIIIVLVVIISAVVIGKILKIKVAKRGKGAVKELKSIEKIRKREDLLVKVRWVLNKITDTVESSPFRLGEANRKNMQYMLKRAGIKGPDGKTTITAETFNALKVSIKAIGVACGLFTAIFISSTLGALIITISIIALDIICDIVIKDKVREKDEEINKNFAGFYLMMHYVLIRGNNSLIGIVKQYDKTTESEEMHKFVDSCVHNFDTYGEYTGSMYVSEEYKGIRNIKKLMRLIRQANTGGDIRSELIGFKQEVLNAETYRMEKKKEKILRILRVAEILIMVLLGQAVISAIMIYLSDLSGGLSSFV